MHSAANGARAADPGAELVELIDHDNRVLGVATRRTVRTLNLLHRGVGILCLNSAGEVYVHRRTETKDVFPGLYDMFVGGVVGVGESFADAARREIAEELAVRAERPRFLFTHFYDGEKNRSLIQVYEVVWDGPVVHQAEEIASGGWIPLRKLNAWVDAHPIVPDGFEIYLHYRRWQELGCPASPAFA